IEDIELGYRIRGAGYKIQLFKDLHVKHLKYWGVVSLLKAEIFYRALPWTDLILRQRQLDNDLNLGLSSRLSVISIYGIFTALILSFWLSGFLAVAGVLSLIMLWLNLAVYRFFYAKRGLGFALRVIPWHWFYYFYGGLAFGVATSNYIWHEWFLPKLDVSTT
ncbi:MAG: glycosyltransferase family 2 protein, partial [Cyanobacteriota bacterium]|nr:glycosyltransferase family 2 protein [Cyanobacteriota bacterium]